MPWRWPNGDPTLEVPCGGTEESRCQTIAGAMLSFKDLAGIKGELTSLELGGSTDVSEFRFSKEMCQGLQACSVTFGEQERCVLFTCTLRCARTSPTSVRVIEK